jgi:class 3 adenylate cyclase
VDERILGFARVLGWATAVLADTLVDAFRVQVEVPRLGAGTSYAEIVEQYTRLAKVGEPSQVIVSDSLREAVREAFDFESASEMAPKGFDGPIAGFRLGRKEA